MSDLREYKNPITTKENINELHNLLVQTCLDYMREHGLTDIDEINFSADGLSGLSYEVGEWTPNTDSSLEVIGLEEDEWEGKSGKKYKTSVRARIGFSM